ncbi:MAG: hypothetical protein RJQ09_02165 [Cyclobacteriaceae bacterium]
MKRILILINQNFSNDVLSKVLKKEVSDLSFISTHQLFDYEKKRIREKIGYSCDFITFADLLSEEDLIECDKLSTEACLNAMYSKSTYVTKFQEKSIYLKNEKVYSKIKRVGFKKIYYVDGLGISGKLWARKGGVNLSKRINQRKNFLRKIVDGAKRQFSITPNSNGNYIDEIFQINAKSNHYYFIGKPNRLRFKQGTILEKVAAIPEKGIRCTTIHNYQPSDDAISKELRVFIDGFHPSNYSRSYLDSYDRSCTFVPRTPFDNKWFKKFNLTTIPPPEFVEPEFFTVIDEIGLKPETVILILNHAGDWSSLINRSDTDILIEAFTNIAYCYPQKNFIIRPHPTMEHSEHEGSNSLRRIFEFVDQLNLENLRVSTEDLKCDLDRGDVFLSEYSQTLLDVFKMGKIGIAVNLTNRESFMRDYEELGFLSANSSEGVTKILDSFFKSQVETVDRQNEAVLKYNKLLKEYLLQSD